MDLRATLAQASGPRVRSDSVPSKKPPTAQNGRVDGRRLRRERGRGAVIDTVFELLLEGRTTPKSEELARRSGVSEASIFRYFENLDDLYQQAFVAFLDRYSSLLDIPRTGEGERPDRVSSFVRARVRYYEAAAPILAAGRSRAIHIGRPEAMEPGRALRSNQVRQQFAPDLEGASATRAADLVASIDTCASAEAWDSLRDHHHRTAEQIRRIWVRNLLAILRAWDEAR